MLLPYALVHNECTMLLYSNVFIFKSRGDVWFIEDETGKQLPALIVFCESLKFLKQSLLEEAKKQQTDIGVDDIKWILTVPAIWSDPAKAFMRRAAVEVRVPFCIILRYETGNTILIIQAIIYYQDTILD